MIEKAFSEFVRDHFTALDELAQRYAEYRIETAQSYWSELRDLIRRNTPIGYVFEGVDRDLLKKKGGTDEEEAGERVIGWSRSVDNLESRATIGFGVNVTVSALARNRWPFANCWTGIRVWAASELQNLLMNSARDLILSTEHRDGVWLFWQSWQPLAAIQPQDLHLRLTESTRSSGHQEILNDLVQWKQNFEAMLTRLPEPP